MIKEFQSYLNLLNKQNKCYQFKPDKNAVIKSFVPCEIKITKNFVCQTVQSNIFFFTNFLILKFFFKLARNYENLKTVKIKGVDCPNTSFYCDISDVCVSYSQVCNFNIDCQYGEDERNCSINQYFICHNGRENIPLHLVCDLRSDCSDNSDEKYCCSYIKFFLINQ